MRNPWPGEADTLPQRIDGYRVVAAIKRPTTPAEVAHQWEVVVEVGAGSDLFCVQRVKRVRGRYVAGDPSEAVIYHAAVYTMITRSGILE